MADITIDTTNRTNFPLVDDAPPAKCWTKAAWADSWTLRDDLIPLEANFTVGATLPTALLHYRYGKVKLPGSATYDTYTPITARGYFVLIAWGTHDGNPLYWLGYAESPITSDHHPARDSLPQAGVQSIPCFGLARALQEAYVLSTVHQNPDLAEEDTPLRTFGAASFNFDATLDRHFGRNDTLRAFGSADPVAYVFEQAFDAGERWSTRDILNYLLAFHVPTLDSLVDDSGIPWELANATAVPDYDAPDVRADGRSVAEIITELLTPSRLLNWTVGVDATFIDANTPPTINALQVYPFTTVRTALTLPDSKTVPANTDTITLTCSTDPQTEATVTEDESEVVDQIIVRGPREIGVGTFLMVDPDDEEPEGELERGWIGTDENKYATAASLATDWASLDLNEQRARNDAYRGSGDLDDVFRTFRLRSDWDGTAKGDPTADAHPVFTPIPGTPPTDYIPYIRAITFEPELPLRVSDDYTGDATAVTESLWKSKRPIFLMIEDPLDAALVPFNLLSGPSNGLNIKHPNMVSFDIHADVESSYRGQVLQLSVSGAPPHAIAGPDFVGTDGDTPQERYGDFDYRDMRITIALRNDRRPYFELPATDSLTLDVVRRRVFTIDHESLELVHIAEGTIVGIDEDGDYLSSDGGVLRDPSTRIEQIATILGTYYLTPRKRCVIRTGWRLAQMQVGAILKSVSTWGTDIDSPIIEIKITSPLQSDGSVTPATMEIIAASDRFDAMSLIGLAGDYLRDAQVS